MAMFSTSLDVICDAMAHAQLTHINSAFDSRTLSPVAARLAQHQNAKLWCDTYGDQTCTHLSTM
jgi:hypothetical protein